MTCHNRRQKTINCLRSLYGCKLPPGYQFEVFLVDDASIDGTSEAVKNDFPKVNVIPGNGKLFWNRGMLLAWETATRLKYFDFYLWLNDDTILFYYAFNILLQKTQTKDGKQILVGATCSSNLNDVTYSGFQFYKTKLIPNGEWQNCDYFNGNIVLIPAIVFKKIGFLDSRFTHTLGDFDYGMRATKMGILNLLSPLVLGICETTPTVPKWRNTDYTVLERIHHLYSPLGNNPNDFFIIDSRQYGYIKAIIHYFTIHIRAIFPSLWK